MAAGAPGVYGSTPEVFTVLNLTTTIYIQKPGNTAPGHLRRRLLG